MRLILILTFICKFLLILILFLLAPQFSKTQKLEKNSLVVYSPWGSRRTLVSLVNYCPSLPTLPWAHWLPTTCCSQVYWAFLKNLLNILGHVPYLDFSRAAILRVSNHHLLVPVAWRWETAGSSGSHGFKSLPLPLSQLTLKKTSQQLWGCLKIYKIGLWGGVRRGFN
jgi:hypothetical protein